MVNSDENFQDTQMAGCLRKIQELEHDMFLNTFILLLRKFKSDVNVGSR